MSNELGTAFANVMNSLAEVSFKKDAFNGGKKNNYITLDAINLQLLPKLREHNLSFIVHRDSEQNFWGTLTYMPTLQEYSKCFGRIELSSTGKKADGSEYELMNTAQAQGATLSYGRRYVTTCFFNLLVDSDTDGEIGKETQRQGNGNQNQRQTKEYPKIQGKEITISQIEIGKRDFKDAHGVLKTVVNISTSQGEKEGIWLNSLDAKKNKKSDCELISSAISGLLQMKEASNFFIPLIITKKVGLTEKIISYLHEKKRNNTLKIETLQQSFDEVPWEEEETGEEVENALGLNIPESQPSVDATALWDQS